MDNLPDKVLQKMMEKDAFSQWLGLNIEAISEGYCRLSFVVKPEMSNGFETLHGGVLFAAADSAFAFACNSHGRLSVALEVSISFTKPGFVGEKLTVEAQEVFLGNKTGIYDIKTTNEKGEILSIFKGTAFRTTRNVLD
jgi:acyl-CoA thioesterase